MPAILERPEYNATVECPETGRPTRVWVEADPTGLQLRGCARFWGDLLCDGACEADAAEAFAEAVKTEACVYCGHPNLAAPRPREVDARGP